MIVLFALLSFDGPLSVVFRTNFLVAKSEYNIEQAANTGNDAQNL